MAWDSKAARRRQQSNAAATAKSLPTHVRQPSKQIGQPRSAHVADPFLHDFLGPSFDPAEYWNASLPPLHVSGSGIQARSGQTTSPLANVSTQAQTTISQLNAHTTRLTNTLTQLTDDILRSGSRLAYEVELLRGETLSFAEALTDGLQDDVVKFVPGGIQDTSGRRPSLSTETNEAARRALVTDQPDAEPKDQSEPALPNEPPYITQLRTLSLVRSRLDSVIKTFGDAMEFVFPPSELSVSSSFLSVSAPEPGAEMHSTEEKGQQVLQKLRADISQLLAKGSDPIRGIEDAARRIEELKQLSQVWKGTAEEKGRVKFIESLAKQVEDKHKDLLRELELSKGRQDNDNGWKRANTDGLDGKGYSAAYGLIQKIRGGL